MAHPEPIVSDTPIWLDEVDSTNAQAVRLLAGGDLTSRWVIARDQTHGRGRQGRAWSSRRGNFMGSYTWLIGQDLAAIHGLSLAIGLAVKDAISAFYTGPEQVLCKWPNDVLIGKGKAAGILIETHKAADGAFWGIMGAGVNLIETPPPDGQKTSSVFEGSSSGLVKPEQFLRVLAPKVEQAIVAWQGRDQHAFIREWQLAAYGLHEPVLIDGKGEGRFDGIEATGEAVVTLSNGQPCLVQAGDLSFLSLAESA
ncbi:MAG: biotin--[acetyl-CoA-carboxylase] ligase [Pseudomonadota bacterium]